MKKFLLSLSLMFIFTLTTAHAYDPNARALVVGANLIKKNSLPSVEIKVTDDTTVTNDNILNDKILYIQSNNLSYTGNDNEVAAVISQELGAIVNASSSKKNLLTALSNSFTEGITDSKAKSTMEVINYFSLSNMSKKDLMEADITGVDLMINAEYNPLAMIVVLGKMDGSLMEVITGSPANIKRTQNIYDYIAYNYPSKIKAGYNCQEYKAFLSYIEPVLLKRQNNKSAMKKFQKTQAKAKATRARNIAKYKITKGVSGWDVTSAVLKSINEKEATTTTTKE